MDHRMIVIYDVDGVICDYNAEFIRWYNSNILEHNRVSSITYNPKTWAFGFENGDCEHITALVDEFHSSHDGIFPLIDELIPGILMEMQKCFKIVILSSYPDEKSRIKNLIDHGILFDEVYCNISDKTAFIQNTFPNERIAAIFEDGPHHIDELIKIFPGRIHAPRMWNYVYDAYHSEHRVKLYNSPYEWLELILGRAENPVNSKLRLELTD